MNKTLRSGIDIDTALRVQGKLSAKLTAASSPRLPAVPAASGRGTVGPRAWLRNTAARLLTSIRNRKIKLRRSLTKELRQELLQELHRLSAAQVTEMQLHRQALERQLGELRTLLSEDDAISARSAMHDIEGDTAKNARLGWRRQLVADIDDIRQRTHVIETYAAAAARRIAIPCSASDVLVRTQVGFVLCSTADHALLACLLDSGDLEIGTRRLIERCLRPGDVFIDVGANIGIHTLAAARAMHGRGRIVAFEPFLPNAERLAKTMEINGYADFVEVRPTAVSDRAGVESLFLGRASGHHSLFPLIDAAGADGSTIDVRLERLDSVIPAASRVDLVKIDAEGAELQVLASCAALIESNPDIALIVEFGPAHMDRTGVAPRDWLAEFERLGLEHRTIDSYSGELESWAFERLVASESVNLLFARTGAPIWERATP